ncbi:MAG: hypothetical protein CSA18_00425 [Deltaproteobacteria bacterium]|nr:MAG: hypothetical protein CSA18_00425 [Deltaproteobacteria bacterium]
MTEKNLIEKNTKGHRERLRQKFFKAGISAFHDYEIIEILLTFGTPRKDCKKIAKELISKFKTIQGVLQADIKELQSVKGVGEVNVFALAFIKSAAEIFLRKKILNKKVFSCSEDVFNYLFYSIGNKDIEFFKVLFLDQGNRLLGVEDIHQGSISSTAVYPREIIKSAIANKAASLIFAHNHPSGLTKPSNADIAITRRLVHACLYIDINVHEHIIIGENNYYSFADNGFIKDFTKEFENFERKYL